MSEINEEEFDDLKFYMEKLEDLDYDLLLDSDRSRITKLELSINLDRYMRRGEYSIKFGILTIKKVCEGKHGESLTTFDIPLKDISKVYWCFGNGFIMFIMKDLTIYEIWFDSYKGKDHIDIEKTSVEEKISDIAYDDYEMWVAQTFDVDL